MTSEYAGKCSGGSTSSEPFKGISANANTSGTDADLIAEIEGFLDSDEAKALAADAALVAA